MANKQIFIPRRQQRSRKKTKTEIIKKNITTFNFCKDCFFYKEKMV